MSELLGRTSLPANIRYGDVKPIGVPSRIRKVKFQPSHPYTEFKGNDVARFYIKAPAFWDPYASFLRLKVDFSEMHENCVQQLDSSAHSFISELVISAGQTEIERISEYDVLAAMLFDCSYSADERKEKSEEGLNGETFETLSFLHNRPDNSTAIETGPHHSTTSGRGFFTGNVGYGWRPTLKSPLPNHISRQEQVIDTENPQNNTYYIPMNHQLGATTNPVNVISENHRVVTAIGADSELAKTYSSYVDKYVGRADHNFSAQRRTGFPGPWSKIYKYPFSFNDNAECHEYYTTVTEDEDSAFCGHGYIFSNEFSAGCFEDTYSKKKFTYAFSGGKSESCVKVAKSYVEYKIPLLSGILGVLMPKTSYKLFPVFAVDNLLIEIRFSPHAVFTSGYNSYADAGAANAYTAYTRDLSPADMFKRTFKIIEAEFECDMVQFDSLINESVKGLLLQGQGLIIPTHSFALGPLLNVANTQALSKTSFDISLPFESMKALFIMFLSNDYLQYTFCRKNYRLSSNLTLLQATIGFERYPEFPLEGHAGNTRVENKYDKDNSIFYGELLRCFSHPADAKSHTIINKYNFALNDRPYDITNLKAYIDKNATYCEGNTDTAVGYPLIHENRMVGKAVYVLNFAYNSDDSMFNGVNTLRDKPMIIRMEADGRSAEKLASETTVKDRARTLYFFANYDFVVQITNSGVTVLGRGGGI